MNINPNNTSKKVSFADQAMLITPAQVLNLSDCEFENLWYQDDEIYSIIKDVKEKGELPLFWYSLRMKRLKLLYQLVAREQFRQQARDSDKVIDWEAYANVCRKISAYSTILALKGAQSVEKTEGVSKENENISTNTDVKNPRNKLSELGVYY